MKTVILPLGLIAESKTVMFPVNTIQPLREYCGGEVQINHIHFSTFPSISNQKQHRTFQFSQGEENQLRREKNETMSLMVLLRL